MRAISVIVILQLTVSFSAMGLHAQDDLPPIQMPDDLPIRLAYFALGDSSDFDRFFVVNGSDAIEIAPGYGLDISTFSAAWMPDCSAIALAAAAPDPGYLWSIYTVNAETGDTRALYDPAPDIPKSIQISASGTWVAFSSYDYLNEVPLVNVVNVEMGDIRTTAIPNIEIETWIDDHRLLLIRRPNTGRDSDPDAGLYLADVSVDLSSPMKIADEVLSAAASPDGSGFVAVAIAPPPSHGANFDLYNADGVYQRTLFNSYALNPVWSPDGRQLAFSGVGGLVETLHIDQPGESLEFRLPDYPMVNYTSAIQGWMPDSQHVLVSTGPSDDHLMYLLDVSTGEYRSVVNAPTMPTGAYVPLICFPPEAHP